MEIVLSNRLLVRMEPFVRFQMHLEAHKALKDNRLINDYARNTHTFFCEALFTDDDSNFE